MTTAEGIKLKVSEYFEGNVEKCLEGSRPPPISFLATFPPKNLNKNSEIDFIQNSLKP